MEDAILLYHKALEMSVEKRWNNGGDLVKANLSAGVALRRRSDVGLAWWNALDANRFHGEAGFDTR